MGYCGEEEPKGTSALSSLSSWHHPQLLIFQQRGAEENRRNPNEKTVGWKQPKTWSYSVVWFMYVLEQRLC